jgi:hypothetical protein
MNCAQNRSASDKTGTTWTMSCSGAGGGGNGATSTSARVEITCSASRSAHASAAGEWAARRMNSGLDLVPHCLRDCRRHAREQALPHGLDTVIGKHGVNGGCCSKPAPYAAMAARASRSTACALRHGPASASASQLVSPSSNCRVTPNHGYSRPQTSRQSSCSPSAINSTSSVGVSCASLSCDSQSSSSRRSRSKPAFSSLISPDRPHLHVMPSCRPGCRRVERRHLGSRSYPVERLDGNAALDGCRPRVTRLETSPRDVAIRARFM